MKDFIVTSFLLLSLVSVTNAQNNLQYQLFNNDEEIANYDGMIKDLVVSDMVFLVSTNNPISLDAIRNEQKFFLIKGRKLFFGAEMFESGNQLVLNEYLKGLYTDDKMTPEITQLWSIIKQIIGLWSILLKKITCVLLLQIFLEDTLP
jgi:hypothetical protein